MSPARARRPAVLQEHRCPMCGSPRGHHAVEYAPHGPLMVHTSCPSCRVIWTADALTDKVHRIEKREAR